MMENSYWELTSHIVPCEKTVIHLPMSTNMTNGNYGGIAAYAFILEALPRIESFTVDTQLFPTLNDIPDVETISEGEGLYKQVRVIYKGSGF